jgi:hypothetical protein
MKDYWPHPGEAIDLHALILEEAEAKGLVPRDPEDDDNATEDTTNARRSRVGHGVIGRVSGAAPRSPAPSAVQDLAVA